MSLPNLPYWVMFASYESMRIRRTSLMEWPAWLKCSDTGVVVLSYWWVRIERRCTFPKAFTELTLRLSDVLKVALFTFYQVSEVFWVARYDDTVIFPHFPIVNKYTSFLQATANCKEAFPKPPVIAYKRNASLSDLLVHSTRSHENSSSHKPTEIQKCNHPRCLTCSFPRECQTT